MQAYCELISYNGCLLVHFKNQTSDYDQVNKDCNIHGNYLKCKLNRLLPDSLLSLQTMRD